MQRISDARARLRAVCAALRAEHGRFLGDYTKLIRECAKAGAKTRRTAWDAAKLLEDGDA